MIGIVLALTLSAQGLPQELAAQEPESAIQSEPLAPEREAVIDRVSAIGLPSEMLPILECRLEGIETTDLGSLKQIQYGAVSARNCDAARELSRAALRVALIGTSPSASERDVDFVLQALERHVDALPESGFVILEPSIKSSGASQPVPPGMWEYFVCKANENSGKVIVDGKPVVPKFKDDVNCDRSRTYARGEAIRRLQESDPGKSPKERAALVEQYVSDVDTRTAKPTAP
jgi:hypothetical protein